ncbi:MAG: class I SAM-dependent methyltransferase [Candidatus Eisenbacteria sp.]|nr:class I SAM-dependent methyltransferase [Candidatus Eisenbacteria bacterium]
MEFAIDRPKLGGFGVESPIRLVGLIFGILVAAGICLRLVARYAHIPCPFWLSGVLQNPLAERRIGSGMLLRRAGVGRGMKVLDVGCGTGRIALPAGECVGAGGEVVALDIQSGMLRKLRARIEQHGLINIRTVHAAAGSGNVERDYFDRALLVGVLGELPSPTEALREIYDALVPGGLLSVTEMLPDPHYQSRGRVRRLAEGVGFRFRESFGNAFVFTLNFEKPSPSEIYGRISS